MTFIHNLPILNITSPKIAFKAAAPAYTPMPDKVFGSGDSFVSNPLKQGFTFEQIEKAARSNPKIREILNSHGLKFNINRSELEKLKDGHLASTRIRATQIYSELPAELKREVNLPNLQFAAMWHDIGKIFIPDDILNKKEKLTNSDFESIKLHSELGAELLKSLGANEEVCNLVKYHHQKYDGSGYPEIEKDFDDSVALEILRVADEYDALTENRSYRSEMSKQEALEIVAKDAQNGIASPSVLEALNSSVKKF